MMEGVPQHSRDAKEPQCLRAKIIKTEGRKGIMNSLPIIEERKHVCPIYQPHQVLL